MNSYMDILKESLKDVNIFDDLIEKLGSGIVKCKNCTHLQKDGRCDKTSLWIGNKKDGGCDNFFCAYGERKKSISFLFLEQKKQLENCFYKWCEENDALKSPFNVISFLAGKDLINIDKTMDYLEEVSNENFLHHT